MTSVVLNEKAGDYVIEVNVEHFVETWETLASEADNLGEDPVEGKNCSDAEKDTRVLTLTSGVKIKAFKTPKEENGYPINAVNSFVKFASGNYSEDFYEASTGKHKDIWKKLLNGSLAFMIKVDMKEKDKKLVVDEAKKCFKLT